ncbi:MAG: S41 family peptidase [Ekhidna sp.]|uniref:S41 family peptidase n=1 Tax=Ekhidna sp. TaxID=2608089 RepID=UPI0032EABB82
MKQLLKNTFILLISTISFSCSSQSEKPISKGKGLIEEVAESIKLYYYDEEVANKIANHMIETQDRGEFSGLSKDDLIAKINVEIHSIKNDRHIQLVSTNGNLKLPWDQSFIREIKFLFGNIGYLKLYQFPQPTEDILNQLDGSLTLLKDTEGLIIDLQNNRGGHPDLVSHLLGYFAEDEVTYDTFYEPRTGKRHEYKTRKKKHSTFFNKPLTVLVNENTGSVAELFSYAVQNLNIGKVYGTQTLGVVNLAEYVPLSDGFYLLISKGIQQNPLNSVGLEGHGVTPDIISNTPQDAGHLQMINQIHGESFENWLTVGSASLEENELKSFVGMYGCIQIRFEDGNLYYQDHSGFRYKLIPISVTTFSLETSSDERFRVMFDTAGSTLKKVYFNGDIVSYQKKTD